MFVITYTHDYARMQAYVPSHVLTRSEPYRASIFQHQGLLEALLARTNVLGHGTRMSKHRFEESMDFFLRFRVCDIVLGPPAHKPVW
jgi:hypothetical protein